LETGLVLQFLFPQLKGGERMSYESASEAVFASRSLLLDGDKEVMICIKRPYKSGDDYDCEYEIHGLGNLSVEPARGVDSLQALLIAIQALRHKLRPYRGRLTWDGSDANDGLPSVMFFESPMNERLGQIIAIAEKRNEARVAQFVADRMADQASAEVLNELNASEEEVDASGRTSIG
jgi:hypothetical protein